METFLNPLVNQAHHYVLKFPRILRLAEIRGLKSIAVARIAVLLLGLLFLTCFFSSTVASFCGIVFPALCATSSVMKQSEQFKNGSKVDPLANQQWLIYFIVFSLFTFVEGFFDFALSMIPFFGVFKIVFFLWLFLPQFQGANVIFLQCIAPRMEKWKTISHTSGAITAILNEDLEEETTSKSTTPAIPPILPKETDLSPTKIIPKDEIKIPVLTRTSVRASNSPPRDKK